MITEENSKINSPVHTNRFLKQIGGFALVGFVSTSIDLLVLKVLLVIGVNVYLSTAIGFFSGLVNGYLMNSHFVFRQVKSPGRYFKYVVVSLAGLLWTELIVDWLHVRSGRFSAMGAKLVAVVLVFFWNYLLSRKWAFK